MTVKMKAPAVELDATTSGVIPALFRRSFALPEGSNTISKDPSGCAGQELRKRVPSSPEYLSRWCASGVSRSGSFRPDGERSGDNMLLALQ